MLVRSVNLDDLGFVINFKAGGRGLCRVDHGALVAINQDPKKTRGRSFPPRRLSRKHDVDGFEFSLRKIRRRPGMVIVVTIVTVEKKTRELELLAGRREAIRCGQPRKTFG